MGTEEKIRRLLEQNYSPQSLIEQGFSKSTVYKIYSSTRTFQSLVRDSYWIVEEIHYNKTRYLPCETIIVSFDITNISDTDIYLLNVGLQTEWMRDTKGTWHWYSQKTRDLLKPGQKRNFSLSVPIPSDITLGEYELRFGLQGQYLPSIRHNNPLNTPEWSLPQIIHIKHPLHEDKVFLSHSIKDEYLVRNLQKDLDNFGVEVIIGEDKDEPNLLEKKFQHLIQSSAIFIALITEPTLQSEWVIWETNYAHSISKPLILLKDKNVDFPSSYEWIEFDRNDSTSLLDIVMLAISKTNYKTENKSHILDFLSIALLSFLAGWYLRK